MPRPLTKRTKEGRRYKRPEEVEEELERVLSLPSEELLEELRREMSENQV